MKFLIHTYGCQMNVRDSEAVEALLIELGHEKVATEAEAELVIVNSCTVRQKAEEKAIGKAGNLIADGKITAKILADVLGVEQRTIERRIRALREKKVLKRIGEDKSGHWQVLV